ncbi:phenylacetic acid degradation protein [Tistrella bauzanensis]|uniref:Phenylacetic acid degradation protein n=1 Tax=Tistrella bauzanensis TaxID=657419 RepID=A0ABQ1I7N3_9PROT|nr:phenylacetic acid degradation protein [Tistrella bauzanensis]
MSGAGVTAPDATTQLPPSDGTAGAADLASGLDGLAQLQAYIDRAGPLSPIGETLGFRLVRITRGEAEIAAEPGPHILNGMGVAHGGYMATLLDAAVACAIHSLMPAGVGSTTVELKVNMVKALPLSAGPVCAIGRAIHTGRMIATAEGRLEDLNGTLYAHATTTCAVLQPRG